MSDSPPRRAISPRLIAAAVLIVLVIVFIAENTGRTKIRFIVPVVNVPVWIALFAAALVGTAAGVLLSRHRRSRP